MLANVLIVFYALALMVVSILGYALGAILVIGSAVFVIWITVQVVKLPFRLISWMAEFRI